MTPTQLIKLRTRLGLSKQQLADALGVKLLSIYRWEDGTTPISRMMVLALKFLEHEHNKNSTDF